LGEAQWEIGYDSTSVQQIVSPLLKQRLKTDLRNASAWRNIFVFSLFWKKKPKA
jgi:hypothetical protein